MDFDALVSLKSILTSDDVKDTDIMLLKSAIKNWNIDTSLSISQNLDLVFLISINESEFMTYLGEFATCESYLLNTPIYQLFLDDIRFYPLLLDALIKKCFDDAVIAYIVNYLFGKLAHLQDEEYIYVALFITEFITWRRNVHYSFPVNYQLLMEFIGYNVDCIKTEEKEYSYSQVTKTLALKLLSYDYIRLSEIASYYENTQVLGMLVVGLLESKEYSYLLSILNEDSVDMATSKYLQGIILEYAMNTGDKDKLIDIIMNKLKELGKIHSSNIRSLM